MFLIPTGPNRGSVCMLRYELDAGTSATYVWDPAIPGVLNETTHATLDSEKICAGMSYMPDGRLLAAGGARIQAPSPTASTDSYFFDPLPGVSWINTGPMNDDRFYPTQVALNASLDSIGKPVVFGGWTYLGASLVGGQTSWEQFDPTNGTWNTIITGPNYFGPSPHAYCLSNDQIMFFADSDAPPPSPGQSGLAQPTSTISPPGTTWFMAPGPNTVAQGPSTPGLVDRVGATSVLLHQLGPNGGTDRVLVFGGGEGLSGSNPPGHQYYKSVDELDLTTNSWVQKADMNIERGGEPNAVVLLTGEVLLVGGMRDDRDYFSSQVPPSTVLYSDWPIGVPELYDPSPFKSPGSGNSTWMAPRQAGVPDPNGNGSLTPLEFTPRGHHAMALLLLDGSVLCAGGANQDPFHMDFAELTGSSIPPQPPFPYPARADVTGEVYKPSYFHSTSRPKLAEAPDKVLFTRNASTPSKFSIKVTSSTTATSFVDRVVLIRPGAVNHALNSTQRYIELSYEVSSGSFPGTVSLKATAPAANLGPVGYYMLFVVVNRTGQTPNRVPTQGHFIKLL